MSQGTVLSCIEAVQRQELSDVKQHVTSYLEKPGKTPSDLRGPLSEAVGLNDVEITRFLLDQGVHKGDFPAEIAVRAKAFEVLELFIQKGWDLNEPLEKHEPPVLGVSLSLGNVEMSNWLLDRGADLNKRCNLDLTPLSYAMAKASIPFIRALFEERDANPMRGQLLHHAIFRETPDVPQLVRFLVEKGVPFDKIKYQDDEPSFHEREWLGLGTPLHRAAELGKLAIVNELLAAGANPNTLDTRGVKAIYWAHQSGHRDVEDILQKAEDACF